MLRDKQFGDKGECCQSSNGITCARTLKKIKPRGLKKWFLCMRGSLALKPSRHKLMFLARAFYFNRDKVTLSTGYEHVLWYLKVMFLVLDLNNGFFT
jgi:hypothetical protein